MEAQQEFPGADDPLTSDVARHPVRPTSWRSM